jgi:[ribosomal protein S18]-alanine N-acetyltransferase
VKTRAAKAPPRLRHGRIGDLDALVDLERELFADRIFAGHVMSRTSIRRFLKSHRSTLIIAEISAHLVGYVLVLYRSNSKLARLYSIGIATQFRRQGLAQKLLRAAEKAASGRGRNAMWLEVRENDPAARTLYQSSGYRTCGKRPGYYGNRIDALRFEKSLDGIHTPT